MDNSIKRRNFIALLAVYFAANVIFIMSPAMNAIATELYPDLPYTSVLLVSTISSLLMIPGSLVAGAALGKVKFKTMALISMGGIIIFGMLPYFIRPLTAVYVFRGIVGFCIGLGFPLQSTLALQLFNDKERPRALGFATVSLSVGSIVFMVVSGMLADQNAAYPPQPGDDPAEGAVCRGQGGDRGSPLPGAGDRQDAPVCHLHRLHVRRRLLRLLSRPAEHVLRLRQ